MTNAFITSGGLLSGILVARMLGPEGRGELAAILLWPGIVAFIATFGSDVALGRRVAVNDKLANRYILIALAIGAAYSTIVLATMLPLLPFLVPSDKQQLVDCGRLTLFAVPALISITLLGAIALGLKNFHAYNVGRLSVTTAYLVFLLCGWLLLNGSLKAVSLAYVAAVWSGAIGIFLLLIGRSRRPYAITPRAFVEVAKDGLPFAPGYVLFAITNNLSIILLTWFADSKALGLYVVALTFVSVQQIVSQALARTAFATMVQPNSEQGGNAEVAMRVRKSLVILAGMGLLLALMSPWVLPLFFGRQFGAASEMAPYLAPAVTLFALAQIMEETLKAKGVAAASLIARIGSGSAMALLAIALIPRHGASGMAVSYLIGGLLEFFIFALFLQRHLNVRVIDVALPRITDWVHLRR